MTDELSSNPWRRLAIGASIVAFLIAVYFFTYNGYAISRDEWFLFDATESIARRGDLRVNYEFDAYPPIAMDEVPAPPADTEPMQPVLAASLFLVAQALPGVGLAHTVWLFNVLITALTAGTLYVYGLALGYRARVAALTALAFGLGTIAWPYSRTFFREPLFTWLALLSVLLVMRVREKLADGQRPLLAGTAFALVFAGALFSKEASLLILPVIVVEALPSRLGQVHVTRRMVMFLVGFAVLGIALLVVAMNADTLLNLDPNRYAVTRRLQQARDNLSGMFGGIAGYMFSPARSMWVFSPVLLLGLGGWRRLIHERRWRQIVTPLVMLATFTVGYAVVRGPEWYGGLGWGSRYLVPVTPLVALWLLPVFETLLERGAAWWQRIGAGFVFLISAGIQIVAVLVPITDYPLVAVKSYYGTLDAQTPPVIPWQDAVWSIRWSPLYVSLELLGDQKADLAWMYAVGETWWLPALAVVLGVLAVGWLAWWIIRREGTRHLAAITAGSLAVGTVLTLGSGLYAIRQDPRYYGDFQPARDLLSQLEKELQPGDVVVLNDYTYNEFFMNYYKLDAPIVYTLPQSPGERFNEDTPPLVESPNPEDLVHLSDTIILADLARRHDRLWLVINASPGITWSVRPVEHYLARHYFPIREIRSTDIARAVLFGLTSAPPATAPAWPEQRVDATFGAEKSLRLVGYDIPGGTTRHSGDVLPVSLLWETLAPVPQNYTVGLFLMTRDGALIQQRDAAPVHFFENTQNWRPGSFHRDNHGLQISDSVPPGEYELWVVLYWWQQPDPEDRLPVTNTAGETTGTHLVLAIITVE